MILLLEFSKSKIRLINLLLFVIIVIILLYILQNIWKYRLCTWRVFLTECFVGKLAKGLKSFLWLKWRPSIRVMNAARRQPEGSFPQVRYRRTRKQNSFNKETLAAARLCPLQKKPPAKAVIDFFSIFHWWTDFFLFHL